MVVYWYIGHTDIFRFDYRDASLIILYLIVIGISTPTIRPIGSSHKKTIVKKVKKQLV